MPDPAFARLFGLVGTGGDLAPATLLKAYSSGVFPWFDEGEPIRWWSPPLRAVFELDAFHISRRLARTIRSGKFRCTIDQDFAGVIRGCADRAEGSWITPDMIDAYETMHALGHAHSVETWHGNDLAGGIYGLSINGFFAGESMFARVSDASKIALAHLVGHLRERGFVLFDSQIINDHTKRMGASVIPRKEYLRRLKKGLAVETTFLA